MPESRDRCVICRRAGLRTKLQRERRACGECARMTGAVPMPPERRPRRPCAACNHDVLIRAIPRGLSPVGDASWAGPMFATHTVKPSEGNPVVPLHPRSGLGTLEVYICKKCGFTEWYCQRPDEIPIGPEFLTEEISVMAKPYR